MRALVMAAGLGTRLRPLTNTLPKPLVPVLGRPMVEYVLEHLARGGVQEAIINIHYLPEKMREFVAAWNGAGKKPFLVLQDESDLILGSGGAVAKAAPWLFAKDDVALVCNADVLAVPDLGALVATHRRLAGEGVEITLVAMEHAEAGKKYTGLQVEGERVKGFGKGEGLFHFPGFYLVGKEVRFPAQAAFSVVEKVWQPLAEAGKLGAFLYKDYYLDLGTPEDLRAAEEFLRGNKRP